MKPKKIWANLAVSDIKRTTAFYTTLGFASNNIHSNATDLASFCVGDDNFVIHFFLKKRLEADMNSKLVDPREGNEILFSLSAESREEVDAWVGKAITAGGTIFAETTQFGKGCYCGFSDPDGHKFNVLYWPA